MSLFRDTDLKIMGLIDIWSQDSIKPGDVSSVKGGKKSTSSRRQISPALQAKCHGLPNNTPWWLEHFIGTRPADMQNGQVWACQRLQHQANLWSVHFFHVTKVPNGCKTIVYLDPSLGAFVYCILSPHILHFWSLYFHYPPRQKWCFLVPHGGKLVLL